MRAYILMAAVSLVAVVSPLRSYAGALTVTLQEAGFASQTFVASTTGASAGVVSLAGISYGTFNAISLTAEGYPASGTSFMPYLSSVAGNVASAVGGALSIWVSQTDYTSATGMNLDASVSGTIAKGSALQTGAYFGGHNLLDGTGSLIGSDDEQGTGLNFAYDGASNEYPTGSYSLTNQFTLSALAGSTSSFAGSISENSLAPSWQLASVPEPASLGLLGAGLVGVGLVRRRRRD